MAESPQDKLIRVLKEPVEITSYDPGWPQSFEREKLHLRSCLPKSLVRRIEHFGSTAVPGLWAKPIIDILVEVTSLAEARRRIVPLLEEQGYEYFWRPSFGDDVPPYYAWFIKRDQQGNRTHHLHMLESHYKQWESLLFRDYLIAHPDVAGEYADLKIRLLAGYKDDRAGYTQAKGDFIRRVTKLARASYRKS